MFRYRKKVDVNDKNKRSLHLWSKENTILCVVCVIKSRKATVSKN